MSCLVLENPEPGQDEVSSGLREACAVGSQGGSPLAGARLEEWRPDRGSVHQEPDI